MTASRSIGTETEDEVAAVAGVALLEARVAAGLVAAGLVAAGLVAAGSAAAPEDAPLPDSIPGEAGYSTKAVWTGVGVVAFCRAVAVSGIMPQHNSITAGTVFQGIRLIQPLNITGNFGIGYEKHSEQLNLTQGYPDLPHGHVC